ncbi:CPXCG motif-containing cysteine-rich protein [Winogradskyella sp. PC D3.3]
MLVDVSQRYQKYIEDCEICCNPIQISILIENQEIKDFQAESTAQ